MNDSDFDNELDRDMDERLARFARSTRATPLPDEVADLPWTVQRDRSKTGRRFPFVSEMAGGLGGFRRGAFALARLGATLAVAGSFLLLVGNVHSSGSAAEFVQAAATPRASSALAAPDAPVVVVVKTNGVVDDVMADYVAGAVRQAESDNAAAVIIQLDTPGGSLDALTRIDASLHAKIPTIVWVGPSGAMAASAGTFITLSANLAYMAPSTSIGAASPVAANGADISSTYGTTEAAKVMSIASTTMRGIAQERHPDAVPWAVATVESAKSYSAEEAFAAHGINGIASSLNDVLTLADNKTVTTAAGDVTLHTKGATILTINEDLIQSLLHTLDDPNIAFILLVLGVLLVAIEFFHPTLMMGILGAMCLALSFYGSGSLPLNVLGVVLVVLGLGMIVLEPNLPTHGVLTVAGVVVFVVGAVAFYGSPGPYGAAESVAWPVIVIMAGAAAAYGLLLVTALLRLRHQPIPVGAGLVGIDEIVGQMGQVQADLAPVGTVYVGRETWSAKTEDGSHLTRNDKVRVIRQEGLTLIVRRVE